MSAITTPPTTRRGLDDQFDTSFLHGDQNPLNVSNALVHFSAAANELGELNVLGSKLAVNLITKVLVNFVVDHCNASAKWLAHVEQEIDGGIQDVAGNLDGGCDGSTHL